MSVLPPPFPERLRRRTVRRRLRLWPLPPAAVACALLLAARWQVTEVRLEPCPGLPPSVGSGLAGLVGSPVATLDLDWVREVVGAWPAVTGVDVRLELPGTLIVRARPSLVSGSVRLKTRWLTIDVQGQPAGTSAEPVPPVLEGFPAGLRGRALSVAERVAQSSGAEVRSLRWVLPDDIAVEVITPDDSSAAVVHLRFEATEGEHWWTERIAAGLAPAFADVRWNHRVVVAEGGAS